MVSHEIKAQMIVMTAQVIMIVLNNQAIPI